MGNGKDVRVTVLLVVLGVGLASTPEDQQRMGQKWKKDQFGWQELNRVVGSHMSIHSVHGLNIAEKINIARGAAGEAAAIKRGSKVSGSLVQSATRAEFFRLMDDWQVFVHDGTLYRSPSVNASTDLSLLSDSELNVYALQCGIPLRFFTGRLPKYLRTIRKLCSAKSKPNRSSARSGTIAAEVANHRRQAVEQQVNAILRGPVHLRLAHLTASGTSGSSSTQFTCFTSSLVQMLTHQRSLLRA